MVTTSLFKRGFTLVELLIVIAIIGVLSSVVLSSINTARSRARDTKRISDLRSLQTALEVRRLDTNNVPVFNNSVVASWTTSFESALVTPGYLSAVPLETHHPAQFYRYINSATSVGSCDGFATNYWEYVIFFRLERPSSAAPNGTLTSYPLYNKCFHGPKR